MINGHSWWNGLKAIVVHSKLCCFVKAPMVWRYIEQQRRTTNKHTQKKRERKTMKLLTIPMKMKSGKRK